MERIADDVFVETGFYGSNNGMVVTREGVVLIDAPFRPTDALEWKRRAEARGRVLYLIETDHHSDHTLGSFCLGGTIVAHEGTRRKLLESPPTPEALRSTLSLIDPAGLPLVEGYVFRLPTITTSDRVALHPGGVTLQLVHFKGHTENGLVVYLPEQRILFSGDLVCEVGLPAFGDAYVFEWLDSLRSIMEMDVELVVPGHGRVCGKEFVPSFYGQMEDLVGRIAAEVDRGVPRERVVERMWYEDRIHTGTEAAPYPAHVREGHQRHSVGRIYDQIVARRHP